MQHFSMGVDLSEIEQLKYLLRFINEHTAFFLCTAVCELLRTRTINVSYSDGNDR